MHDAVQLEQLGIPAAVVITEAFEDLAATFAKTLGVPGYPAVIVPHPMNTRDPYELAAVCADVAVTQLTAS